MYLWYQKQNKKKNRVRYNNLEVERRIRYKEELIRLLGGKCFDCETVYPTPVYDFHHLDPSKKEASVAQLMQCSWEECKKRYLVNVFFCVLIVIE